jgi:hypothetical protein
MLPAAALLSPAALDLLCDLEKSGYGAENATPTEGEL